MENSKVKYKKIYSDLIRKLFPEKVQLLETFMHKNELSPLEVIQLNQKIFDSSHTENFDINQKFKSYNSEMIYKILNYQKTHQLNNSQLAKHFNLSRNTVTVWKKKYQVK